jgi:hypothetical protein
LRRGLLSYASRLLPEIRDYWVAKNATRRADRSDPSLRKERWFRMTSELQSAKNAGRNDNQIAPAESDAMWLSSIILVASIWPE